MNWAIDIAALIVFSGMTAFAGWKAGRPLKDTPKVQWISWPWLTVMAGAATAFALAYAMSLLGIHAGSSGAGKYGP